MMKQGWRNPPLFFCFEKWQIISKIIKIVKKIIKNFQVFFLVVSKVFQICQVFSNKF